LRLERSSICQSSLNVCLSFGLLPALAKGKELMFQMLMVICGILDLRIEGFAGGLRFVAGLCCGKRFGADDLGALVGIALGEGFQLAGKVVATGTVLLSLIGECA
jgi:hypothetical protein